LSITRDDIIKGYREFLAAPPPDEQTMQELLRTYSSVATFQRRLSESAECQRMMSLAGRSPNAH